MHLIAEPLLIITTCTTSHYSLSTTYLVVCQVVLVPPEEVGWSSAGPLPVQTHHSLCPHLPLGYRHELEDRNIKQFYMAGWQTRY